MIKVLATVIDDACSPSAAPMIVMASPSGGCIEMLQHSPSRRARRTETAAAVCARWQRQRRYARLGFGKRPVTARRKARRKGRP
jgi:hypothetical protein